MKKIVVAFVALSIMAGPAMASVKTIKLGKELYHSQKFKCYTCHGQRAQGGSAPNLRKAANKFSKATLLKRAAHMCPPTGMCSPKQLGAIVDYLRSL
ncbi:MAG: c-type cytochrome [Nitrospinae bacterium]|nr:c-type cytochrome [Nitrospinota bacterium]